MTAEILPPWAPLIGLLIGAALGALLALVHAAANPLPRPYTFRKDPPTMIRVPARVYAYLEGTQFAQDADTNWCRGNPPGNAHERLWGRLAVTRPRADGSRWIDPPDDERDILRDYATTLATVARANIGDDPNELADYNAAQAVLRSLEQDPR